MSNFDESNEKESPTLRSEIATKSKYHNEVKELLSEIEYSQYLNDLNEDRDLTFKGKNVNDYNTSDRTNLTEEEKIKYRALKKQQLKITLEMERLKDKEYKKKIEQKKINQIKKLEDTLEKNRNLEKKLINDEIVRREKKKKDNEDLQKMIEQNLNTINDEFERREKERKDDEAKKFKDEINKKMVLKNEEEKRENLRLKGKINQVQNTINQITVDPENETITDKDLTDLGFRRATNSIDEEGNFINNEQIAQDFDQNREAVRNLDNKKTFFSTLINQVRLKVKKMPDGRLKNDYTRFLNFLDNGMEIDNSEQMRTYLEQFEDSNLEELNYIVEADYQVLVLFLIFTEHSLEVDPQDLDNFFRKYLSFKKERNFKNLYLKYKNKYIKLKEGLNKT